MKDEVVPSMKDAQDAAAKQRAIQFQNIKYTLKIEKKNYFNKKKTIFYSIFYFEILKTP